MYIYCTCNLPHSCTLHNQCSNDTSELLSYRNTIETAKCKKHFIYMYMYCTCNLPHSYTLHNQCSKDTSELLKLQEHN